MSWWFSALLAAAVIALLGTVIYETLLNRDSLSGIVIDSYTLSPVPGATVVGGGKLAVSSSDGHFSIHGQPTSVAARKTGYDSAAATVTSSGSVLRLMLRPNVVRGTVVNTVDRKPVAGVRVTLTLRAKTIGTTTTGPSGEYAFAGVPEGATIRFDADDFAEMTQQLSHDTEVNVALQPDVLSGRVTDVTGKPIAGATVATGSVLAVTGSDGTYRLKGVTGSGNVVFKAPGFSAMSAPMTATLKQNATLTPFQVKAIYASAETAANQQSVNGLINIADTTDVNAIVIDLKDVSGHVYFNSSVPLAQQIGAIKPEFDPTNLVNELHQHQIYAIARIVVFEDPILAAARPNWAIHDAATGGLWRTWDGQSWVNPYQQDVWDYNISLAQEAAALGFDEIELDELQFPMDGPLNTESFGVTSDDQSRPQAIGDFLTKMYAAIAPTHAYLAADVSGQTLWETGDGEIGQNLEDIAAHVDYVCPTLYPSGFTDGSLGFDVPNDHPYEVVLWSLQNAASRVPQYKAKLRPWLQDFSVGEGIAYGANEVKRQIDATSDFGASGWMFWNADNTYDSSGFASNGSP